MEELAAKIYAELSPASQVTLDDHILGESGMVRQVDVSIRTTVAGVELLIAVETKDTGTRRTAIGSTQRSVPMSPLVTSLPDREQGSRCARHVANRRRNSRRRSS